MTTNPQVDKYLIDGCMRCPYGATPQCKVIPWRELIENIRQIILETGLQEEIKWGVPVYTNAQKNIVTLSALKSNVILGFYKGVLMQDPHNILQQQGSIQSARILRFTSIVEVDKYADIIKDYIQEAIKIELSGQKVILKKELDPLPDELIEMFEEDFLFKEAFYALTPGRQRGYVIHFSQPKNSSTRISRIHKCKTQILMGKGLHDDYKK